MTGKQLGCLSSGSNLLELIVYDDVNTTGVDIVKETNAQYIVHNNSRQTSMSDTFRNTLLMEENIFKWNLAKTSFMHIQGS